MVFSMATNQNMKAFALSPRVTPLVFFLHYFFYFFVFDSFCDGLRQSAEIPTTRGALFGSSIWMSPER